MPHGTDLLPRSSQLGEGRLKTKRKCGVAGRRESNSFASLAAQQKAKGSRNNLVVFAGPLSIVPMWTPRLLVTVFALGGLGGALFDQIHVRFGVLGYPRDDYFAQSWWVAPNFGLAALSILLGSVVFGSALRDAGQARRRDFVEALGWFVGAYFASGLLAAWPMALSAGYVAAWLLRVLPRSDRRLVCLHSLALALLGTGYEIVLSSAGWFHYSDPHLVTVPMWLPGLYLHVGPLGLAFARALKARSAVPAAAAATAPASALPASDLAPQSACSPN